MNVDRLLHLVKILRAVEADDEKSARFDMDQWFADCGTASCAGGFACEDPEFQAAGLSRCPSWDCPKFDGKLRYRALSKFFGIESEFIFDPMYYDIKENHIKPRDVIDRIIYLIGDQDA